MPWRSSDASCQQLGQETLAEQAIVGRWNQAEAMGAMVVIASNDPRVLTVLTLGDPQALTYLRTYSLTYLRTYLLTYLLTHLLTHSLTHSLARLLTYLLTY